jgi:DNA replication protein DnaC
MDLLNVLEFSKKKPLTTILTSKVVDGSFGIHFILSDCLRQDSCKIVFLNFAQTFSHYKSVQSKLGNLNTLTNKVNNADLLNIDCLSSERNLIQLRSNHENNDQYIADLIQKIEEFVKKDGNAEKKVFVFIDDLSILQLMGYKDKLINYFLNRIKISNENVHLIAYVQEMHLNQMFVNDLIYSADLMLAIENLSTGYSKEIDGQVKAFCIKYISNSHDQLIFVIILR